MKQKLFFATIVVTALCFLNKKAFSQIKVGSNPTTINSGSIMEYETTNKGILLPRVALTDTSTWTLAGTSVDGMFVYNTATVSGKLAPGVYFWKTSKWHAVSEGVGTNNFWGTKGNTGNSWRYNFFGSTDNTSLRIKTNNVARMIIDSTGNVGINTTSPGSSLDVKGTIRMSGATSGYVGLAPAATAGSTIYTLPAADGTSGYQLTTNGAGALSWVAAGGTTTHTLSSATNTITSVVNGVSVTANAVNSVANTSSGNNLTTTINGVAGTSVPMVNTISNTSSANTLSTTVNGVAGSTVPIVNSISNTSSANTLSTTVNGVAGSTVPIVNSISNTSSTNTLTTTVNGVAGTGVNIINSNATSLSGTNLTTTVNGVAATALDLTPAITSVAWSKTGNSGTTSGTNFVGTTDAQDLMLKTNSTERFTINKTTGFIHLNQGNQSTIMGYQAAQSSNIALASANVGIGYQAMYSNTTGGRNVAMGFLALNQNLIGQDNIAVGITSLNASKGNYNTAIGSSAGYFLASGNKNIFIGHNSAISHTSGSSNIFIGDSVNYNGASTGSNLLNIGNAIYGSNIYNSTPFIGIGQTSPGSALDVKGTLRLSGSTSGYVGLAPAAAAGSTTYTLPAADGSSGQQLSTNGAGVLSWTNQANTTTNTLSLATNTLTSTVDGVAATASAVGSVSNTSSTNTLSTTVNGVAGTGVNIINSNALNSSTNTLTSTVNGVAASGVTIINSNATSLSGTNLTTTVNGVAATALNLAPLDSSIFKTDGTLRSARTVTMNANNLTLNSTTGNLIYNPSLGGKMGIGTTTPGSSLDVKGTLRLSGSVSGFVGFAPAAIAGGTTYTLPSADGSSGYQLTTNGLGILTWAAAGGAATTVSNTSSANNLSTTVNGVTGSTVPMVNSISNTSSTNTLTTTVNGVAGTGVNIINSNALSLSGTSITSTVNGVASSGLNIAAIDSSIYKTDGALRSGRTVTMNGNSLTLNSTAGNLIFNPSATGKMGIGTTSPGQKLETMNGNILLNNNNNTSAELRIAEPSTSGSNYTAFKTQAQSATVTYTLPAADGAASSTLQTDGSGNLSWVSMGTTKLVKKTVDESVTSNTTLQDDDALTMNIAANEIWEVTFRLRVVGASAGDIKLAVVTPAGATMWLAVQGNTDASDDDYVEMLTSGTGYSFPGTGSTWNMTATGNLIEIKGLVTNSSTAGTVKLRWAQLNSNATATTVKALSYLTASRLQ